MQERISIIVPVYNVEKYIRRCLDSILNQTYKNIEIIIINDGSKDNSKIICEQYSDKYKNIRVFNKLNGGVSSARNLGIDMAMGNYIAFIDPDDYIDTNMINVLYKNIIKYNSDIAISSVNIIKNGIEYIEDNSNNIKVFESEEAIRKFYNEEYPFNQNYLCNKLFKKSLFNDIRLKVNISYQEDTEVMIRLLNNSNNVVYIATPLYFYDLRETSLSMSSIPSSKLTGERAFFYIYEYTKIELRNYTSIALLRYIKFIFNIIIEVLKYDEYSEEYMKIRKKIGKVYLDVIKDKVIPTKYKLHTIFILIFPKIYKIYIKRRIKSCL